MNARRVLPVFLVVDVVCAAVCLAVLTVGGPTPYRVAVLLGAVSSALFVAARLRQSRGRP